MTNKITFFSFWVLFAGLFVFFLFPTLKNLTNGFPPFLGLDTNTKKVIFTTHIVSGILAYITAFLQFAPFVRNKHITFHRMLGRYYIGVALICIATLFYFILMRKDAGSPFWPSQLIATSLWLIFLLLAFYFVRQKKITWHRRFMISGFICAAYFVTVRIVDRYGMGIFESIFPDERAALMISDVFVWAVPLIFCWTYWLWLSYGSNRIPNRGTGA